MPALTLHCAARSELGGRANNEDRLLGTPRLLAVADGVGGAVAGEVASSIVILALSLLDKSWLECPLPDALAQAVVRGNETLSFVAECRPELAGMSTTLTALALADDGRYLVVNVGDSRTYLYRRGALRQLTRDDSLVQALVDQGAITRAQAARHPQRSIVLEALDGRPREPRAPRVLAAAPGDRLLLCSDGLSDVLDDDALATGLAIAGRGAAAEHLVSAALHAGARDNITVIVADVVATDDERLGWLPEPAAATR
jgi:serine/threonine protein phosphatase PrpC